MEQISRVQKLVDALRSGEFSQGKGHLHTNEGFCCLGVACEIYRRETDLGEWVDHKPTYKAFKLPEKESHLTGTNIAGVTAILPAEVARWFGFSTTTGIYHENSSLANDNDIGKTFAEIADIIENNPEGLFDPIIDS